MSFVEITEASYRCSKPIFKPIPAAAEREYKMIKFRGKEVARATWKRSVICGGVPTKLAKYDYNGAIRIVPSVPSGQNDIVIHVQSGNFLGLMGKGRFAQVYLLHG